MASALLQYCYLQVLDFLTTVAFLLRGVGEGNPLVRWAMIAAPDPLWGLAAVKMIALAIGLYCWRTGKAPLLSRINWFFAVVVVWNLVALIVISAS